MALWACALRPRAVLQSTKVDLCSLIDGGRRIRTCHELAEDEAWPNDERKSEWRPSGNNKEVPTLTTIHATGTVSKRLNHTRNYHHYNTRQNHETTTQYLLQKSFHHHLNLPSQLLTTLLLIRRSPGAGRLYRASSCRASTVHLDSLLSSP